MVKSANLLDLTPCLHSIRCFEAVMLSAYGDESSDETKQRVFAIGGLFGTREQWVTIRKQWRVLTGGHIFHATDCDTDQGDLYPKNNHRKNKELYAALTRLIAGSGLIGQGVAVDLQAFKDLPLVPLDENPYYICFHAVLIALASHSQYCIPRDRIKFTFDRNQQIEYNAAALYDHMINDDDTEGFEYIKLMHDELGFATRKTIGIQAADLIAREAMKTLDNQIGPVSRPARISTKVLWESGRVKFRIFDRPWLEKMINKARRDQVLAEGYFDWLEKTRRQNTLANMLWYERSLS